MDGTREVIDQSILRATNTIPALLLITNCPTHCEMYEVDGFIVRQCGSKDTYLDRNRKPFKENIAVWISKPKEEKTIKF